MGKAIKISIGIIALLLLASPYFAGGRVEKDYNHLIAKLNSLSNGEVKIVGKFNRGIFSSTATTTIGAGDGGGKPFKLEHAIKHGPLIFANNEGKFRIFPKIGKVAQVNTTFGDDVQKTIEIVYGNNEAYKMITNVSLNGDIETEFTNYPFVKEDAGSKLNWQGVSANITLNEEFTRYNIIVKMPLINYVEGTDIKNEVSFTNLKFEAYQSDKVGNDKASMSLENFKLMGLADHLEIAGFNTLLTHKTAKGLMDADFEMSFKKLVVTDQEFGPLTFDAEIKNCDLAAFTSLSEYPKTFGSDTLKLSDERVKKLLANRIQLNLKMHFNTPQGNIAIDSNTEAGGADVNTSDEKQMLDSITSTSSFKIGDKLFVQLLVKYAENDIQQQERLYYANNATSQIPNPYSMTAQQMKAIVSIWVKKALDFLIAEKFVTLQGDTYSSDISQVKGTLTINGIVKTKADWDKLQEVATSIVPKDRTVVPVAPMPSATPEPAVTPTPTDAPALTPAVPDDITQNK